MEDSLAGLCRNIVCNGRYELIRVGPQNLKSLKWRVHGHISVSQQNHPLTINLSCAISGEEFPVSIDEPLLLRFVPEGAIDPALSADEEIEIDLSGEDSDEIDYSGDAFDLGEAVAQSLGLAIDPYATGPNADAAREKAGITSDDVPSGPLAAALAALKKD